MYIGSSVIPTLRKKCTLVKQKHLKWSLFHLKNEKTLYFKVAKLLQGLIDKTAAEDSLLLYARLEMQKNWRSNTVKNDKAIKTKYNHCSKMLP